MVLTPVLMPVPVSVSVWMLVATPRLVAAAGAGGRPSRRCHGRRAVVLTRTVQRGKVADEALGVR